MGGGYGAGMDPTPYIVLAYALGTLGLFGFAAWMLKERMALRKAARALERPKGS